MTRKIETNYAVPLADFIEEILEEGEVQNLNELAAKMGADVTRNKALLLDIMQVKPLTQEGAEGLHTATGVSAEYWMRLDALYWDDSKRLGLLPGERSVFDETFADRMARKSVEAVTHSSWAEKQ